MSTMEEMQPSQMHYMQKPTDDDFQTYLDKARSYGFEVDLNSISKNQPVAITDNAYQFLINPEHNSQSNELTSNFDPIMEPNDGTNDLVYVLNDGTQIRASQIHFDNDDPLVDFTSEKIPFVKFSDDPTDFDEDDFEIEETKKINIVESPVSHWSNKNCSPKCSFANSLPFKLVCNDTSMFEAQFTKYLENSISKTYATLNTVTTRNKSPKSLIKENFKSYNETYRNDNLSHTRDEILNMFKDSPMTTVSYDQGSTERRHVRKTDPSRLVHKNWSKPCSYIDVDGVIIGGSESQICFICANHVGNGVDKLYLFNNEDQRVHRCSPQKKMSTQLKIICEGCLNEYFKPCRMKSANQFLNHDEFLVIKNNQQYIFQKIKNFTCHTSKALNKVNRNGKDEFVKFEIGSDGEIITRPLDNDPRSDDVLVVKDVKKDGSSSDVEIIEPDMEMECAIDNLDESDERLKEFLGKYQCDNAEDIELKCRFCERVFADVLEVSEHCESHKHDLEDGEVFPCPLCNYGYANLKWLKAHVKAAHEKNDKNANKGTTADEGVQDASQERAPTASRTQSSNKKDALNEETEKTLTEDNNLESTTKSVEAPLVKTEVKQECLDSSEDEIWILQTSDAQAPRELQKLIDAAEVGVNEQTSGAKEPDTCSNCRKRGRKRKLAAKADDQPYVPSEEDFIKRAQGRPRRVNASGDSDLYVVRSRKKRSKEPTSDPQIVTCHNCNESFTSKVRLKFHMQFHEPVNTLTAEGRYGCAQCPGVTFTTETALFDHVHFQHLKVRRWRCPVDNCGKTFHLRATLTKHSRTHTDTRRYVCVTCGKRFLDKQTLDEHGVTHLQIKPFQCHICLKQLTRRSRLRMHLRAHEEEMAPALVRVCAACMRAFRDETDAQEHALQSTECLEAFASELKEEAEEMTVQLSPTSGLVKNAVQIIESPKLVVPVARQVPSPRAEPLLSAMCDEARSLIRVVEIEKAFRCEYCEDVFYLESGLNLHRVVHKGVKNPFTCHICKVSFATYSRCTTHKTTHGFYKRSLAEAKKRPSSEGDAGPSATGILGYGDFPVVKHFLCEDCGRSYLHWTYLQVHRRMKHANENCVHQCNQCEITFPNSWSLAYHRKKVHGKTGADEFGPTVKVAKEVYRIPCRDCDEVLPNKNALYRHRKKEHTDMSLDIDSDTGLHVSSDVNGHQTRSPSSQSRSGVACASCGARFPTGDALAQHERAHCPRRPHQCTVCVRSFRTLSMLNEHVRVHTGERPFPCDVCGVAFRRLTAMRNHRLIHTGVRAFACGRCPKRFRLRSELRTHLRLKHPTSTLVIEMRGLDPSTEEVLHQLAIRDIPHDRVIEITKMSFAKGTRSVVPDGARALAVLGGVQRTSVAVATHPPPLPVPIGPPRRGRGIAKNPRPYKIVQGADDADAPPSAYPAELSVTSEVLPDLNVQLLQTDGPRLA